MRLGHVGKQEWDGIIPIFRRLRGMSTNVLQVGVRAYDRSRSKFLQREPDRYLFINSINPCSDRFRQRDAQVLSHYSTRRCLFARTTRDESFPPPTQSTSTSSRFLAGLQTLEPPKVGSGGVASSKTRCHIVPSR